jgi:Fur family peroxide stress response transcriptional regulator
MKKFMMQSSEATNKKQHFERFKQICKENGIKLTPQRLIIYEELINTAEHPSTDMLYQKVKETFPTISFDTVNRTLLTFHHIGVASLVEGTGNPKRFDGNLGRHHHFQCMKCKKIVDIYDETYDNIQLSPEIQDTFDILKITIHLEGVCDECR